MDKSIDELLNGEPIQDEAPAVEASPEPEAPQGDGRPRDEHGRFAPKEGTGVEPQPEATQAEEAEPVPPTGDQLPKDVYEPLKAERQKRQELQMQLEALQQQIARQNQAPPPEVPEFWDNPDAAFEARFERFGSQLMQQFKMQQDMERINASEVAAKGKYADYGESFGAFQQAANANPALIDQMKAAPDPAEFAYKTGKRAMDLEKVGSLDELLKAERAKWEAELKAAAPAPQAFPSTTATDGSVGQRSGPAWAGPTDISDLLRQ